MWVALLVRVGNLFVRPPSPKDSLKYIETYIKMVWVYLNRGAGNKQKASKVFEMALSEADGGSYPID